MTPAPPETEPGDAPTVGAARWVHHLPELAMVLFGVTLRLLMFHNYDVRWGYDFTAHWPYVKWFSQHWNLPEIDMCREAYHPPFYYLVAGTLVRLGAKEHGVGALSTLFGCLRLGLLWWGLRIHLRGHRVARIVALALAAVIPAGLLNDGMVSGEALSTLLATAAIILMPLTFRSDGKQRWRRALLLGFVLAIGLLTKISALTLVGAVGIAALVEIGWRAGSARERLRRFLPLLAGLGVLLAIAGPYFVHNQRAYGKPVLSGFDGPDRYHITPAMKAVPYFDRRPIGFFLGWTNDIFRQPFYPSGGLPRARFFPVLIATTFNDYFNYSFALPHKNLRADEVVKANGRPLERRVVKLAQLAVLGGALIVLITFIAWGVALVSVFRRRAVAELVLLLVPLLALAGALHFAIQYPLDAEGIVKGTYLQFAAPPLFALFGLAVERLWRSARLLVVAPIASIAFAAAYVLYARI